MYSHKQWMIFFLGCLFAGNALAFSLNATTDEEAAANHREAWRVEDKIQQDKRDASRREDAIQARKRDDARIDQKRWDAQHNR